MFVTDIRLGNLDQSPLLLSVVYILLCDRSLDQRLLLVWTRCDICAFVLMWELARLCIWRWVWEVAVASRKARSRTWRLQAQPTCRSNHRKPALSTRLVPAPTRRGSPGAPGLVGLPMPGRAVDVARSAGAAVLSPMGLHRNPTPQSRW